MAGTDTEKWDAIYRTGKHGNGQAQPAKVLVENQHLLPDQGKALDLATGRGANAILLAQHGLDTCAWDISTIAIEKLKEISSSLDLDINTEVRDVVAHPLEANSFDVIVVSHFLDRQIMPQIISALRENGMLFYQTFTIARVKDTGPSSEKYRLGKNELLNLCNDLDVIVYQEEDIIGNVDAGFRNEALFIGQRKNK